MEKRWGEYGGVTTWGDLLVGHAGSWLTRGSGGDNTGDAEVTSWWVMQVEASGYLSRSTPCLPPGGSCQCLSSACIARMKSSSDGTCF